MCACCCQPKIQAVNVPTREIGRQHDYLPKALSLSNYSNILKYGAYFKDVTSLPMSSRTSAFYEETHFPEVK